ncbi:MAG: hypothetical protein A2504_12540 [Bdellovibrionales bacterium RIFOXYD12_FULL_39_22]|nr:MAG: hypothetical protein A2385_00120 [Bdellovibrionales bacterium RIFOXYB1_FULL_39_21]OFZ44061.1 MAG: hypothetical protein A2485_03785 [Bdellovibrionales bacterium RIFOXYC12_FULL_39_17]OFZ48537.1 MAG: hypothetical protein A2404_07285 [Bdellovibrionales bacterium RIFOXYC1_FULL_39_130]OFZ76725.1 MAG: hypothetical protein A2560_11660 [Bdellovibrionales bacterium RIFOXYD1_FULL_39_84]OFZ95003.1 MAG: hypothetical protein A2504_12540 [Bdellovibrionales bacterium RIFOXYD12_FULL_39_22]HLE11188.1 50
MYELLEVESRGNGNGVNLNKMRKDGYVPGVVFGKEMDSLAIKISEMKLLKQLSHKAKIIELMVDGKNKLLVNIESIQKHAVSGKILHVSFLKINADKKTTVTVPIVLTGHSHGVTATGTVSQAFETLTISGLPKDLPDSIAIDVSHLQLHAKIHMSEIKLPTGVSLADKHDHETVVISIHATKEAEEEPVAKTVTEGGEDKTEGAAEAAPAAKKAEKSAEA